MKRRAFLTTAAGATALAAGAPVSGLEIGAWPHGGARPQSGSRTALEDGSIGGIPPARLRDQYRKEFDEFLEFFDRHVVDREFGGFTCAVNHDGTPISTDKTAWYEGRGIWCYSYMYNHNLAREDKYLDCAQRSVDFILKHRPAGTAHWPATYTREGTVIDRNGSLPGDCYIAEGLAEFSRATGDKKCEDIARETLFKALAKYDDPGFKDGASPYPGARNQWYWMLFMWFGTNWLAKKPDPELEAVVDRCLDALLDHHLNPDFELWNLVINHDLSRPSGENIAHARLAGCGHATEATWMIMYEAVRRRDKALFDRAAGVFKRHVDVSWDDVYGGVFNDLEDVDENRWSNLTKIFWAQAFVLIGSLQAVEHTAAPWAGEMFARQFEYVETKCRLDRWGFPLVIDSADRKVTALPKASRKDIYHHPRYLMLCLEALERMVKRSGKTSGVFGEKGGAA